MGEQEKERELTHTHTDGEKRGRYRRNSNARGTSGAEQKKKTGGEDEEEEGGHDIRRKSFASLASSMPCRRSSSMWASRRLFQEIEGEEQGKKKGKKGEGGVGGGGAVPQGLCPSEHATSSAAPHIQLTCSTDALQTSGRSTARFTCRNKAVNRLWSARKEKKTTTRELFTVWRLSKHTSSIHLNRREGGSGWVGGATNLQLHQHDSSFQITCSTCTLLEHTWKMCLLQRGDLLENLWQEPET